MRSGSPRKARFTLLDRNPLALGCWALGGKDWGGQSEKDSMAVMEEAFRRGICHFDTAQGYGVSERLVGKFIADKREQVFLASKVYPRGGGEHVREVIQRSLDHLRTDFIDLYYLHWPVRGGDIQEQMEVMAEAQAAGYIGAIGVSNYSLDQLKEAESVAPVDFYQGGYHVFWRVLEREILPYCCAKKIRFAGYSSLAQGILTGKFPEHPHFPKGDHRGNHVLHFRNDVWPLVYEAVEQLKRLAQEVDRPLGHLALQWCVGQPGVTSVLVGARKPSQVAQNASALEMPVAASILEAMTRISDELTGKLPEAAHIFDV